MAERLRIAQLAPIACPVHPGSTRSIEHLVSLLTEELVRRGHEVTLFATGDSETTAALQAIYPRGYEDDDELWNWRCHETLHVASAFERAGDFDLIHSHNYHFALPFTRLVETPVIHSYHVLPNDDIVRAYARYPEAQIVAMSRYQAGVFGRGSEVAVVHHGIDTSTFPFSRRRGEYLFFLGRIIPDKGPVEAIGLARKVDMRLILAGPCDEDDDYFQSEVAPLIDGRQIEYVGSLDAPKRNELLSGAAALLYPIMDPEPFGLVLIEAMACGTPVAAVGRGAVPEIVENGVTGHYAASVDELAALIPATVALDRTRVRQAAVARWDYRRMVDEYETVYQRLTARACVSLARSAGEGCAAPSRALRANPLGPSSR